MEFVQCTLPGLRLVFRDCFGLLPKWTFGGSHIW